MHKGFRCRLGLHHWQKKWDHERSADVRKCARCGKRMGTGWPGAGAMGV